MTSFALTTFISVVGMHPFRSADSLWYRAALCLAFVAIYLLFAGPLLSQLQASGHAHHDEHALCLSHSDPTPSSSHALEHWHHQCDYCGVWQPSSSAPNHLPAIGQGVYRRVAIAKHVLPTDGGMARLPPRLPSCSPLAAGQLTP
ncbi:hypothetical protein [Halomonas sp. GFAJ-1]|uniref:hypothetical protein n=1 Tax=Halomonas sp. GFAJ-1 TaxID=1118153 RepID=UPI001111BB97|nr:hypothetical protein [Halomonas sp. GFAJ-1]